MGYDQINANGSKPNKPCLYSADPGSVICGGIEKERRTKWDKNALNPRSHHRFLDGLIRPDTYAQGRVSLAGIIEKFEIGWAAKINDIPKQLEIVMMVVSLFEALGISKNLDAGSTESGVYLQELYSNQTASANIFLETVAAQLMTRASLAVMNPILEEIMTASSIAYTVFSKGFSINEMARKEPKELQLAVTSAAITFAFLHARNPHRGAYAQAAVILVQQAFLASSYSKQLLKHGIFAAIGSHIAHNLFGLLIKDLATTADAYLHLVRSSLEGQPVDDSGYHIEAVSGLIVTLLLIGLMTSGFMLLKRSTSPPN
jgi:hypothetical protein